MPRPPHCCSAAVLLAALLGILAGGAMAGGEVAVAVLLGAGAVFIVGRTILECAAASAVFLKVVRRIERVERIQGADVNS